MAGKKKKLLIFGIALVVILIIVANFTMNTSEATMVDADVATKQELVEKVSASGRVKPQTKVDITSEVNGEIIGLFVREGDRVQAGQLLIQLDTVEYAADVRQARFALEEIESRVSGAKTNLEQTEEEFARQQRLYESDLTSETEFKNARYAYQSARATYEALQAQRHQFQAALERQLNFLDRTRINAPMSGVVTYLDAEVGEIAAAQTAFTQGRTLMTISNLDVFEVEVEVDETEIAKVELGQPVDIEIDAFPDTVFEGEVVEIGNTALLAGAGTESQSTNFRVKVIFKDVNKNIRTGMSATVDIESARRDEALTIPYSAVVIRSLDVDSLERAERGEIPEEAEGSTGTVHAAEGTTDVIDDEKVDNRKDVKGTYVIRNGLVEFVKIETGIADQQYIEVISGLEPGDSVVSGPYRVLRNIDHGDEVQARKSSMNENN